MGKDYAYRVRILLREEWGREDVGIVGRWCNARYGCSRLRLEVREVKF